MNIVFDIVLIALFGFLLIRGYLKGFMKTILGFGRFVLAVIITLIFGAQFSGWIDVTFVNPPIYNAIYGKISEMASLATGSVDTFLADITEKYGNFIDTTSLQVGDSVDPLVESVSQSISGAISIVVSTIIGYILLFVLSFVLLTVVIFLVSKFAKLPVIGKVDKILGLVVGLVSGLVAASLLGTVLYAIATLFTPAEEISGVLKFVHDLNFFGFVFDKILP